MSSLWSRPFSHGKKKPHQSTGRGGQVRSEKWDHGRFPALVLSRSGSEGAWRAIHTFRTLGPGATLSATVGSPSLLVDQHTRWVFRLSTTGTHQSECWVFRGAGFWVFWAR